MQLSARKNAILAELIKSYILTGDPVGSKSLSASIGVSSATLRNDMGELCEMGYLEQPHTSAGRIPTNKAYQLYISSLMVRREVTSEMKLAIDGMLQKASRDPENIFSLAGEVLVNLTGMPTLLATVSGEGVYVRRVELLPMGRYTLLIVLITSEGIARSRICKTSEPLTPPIIARFDRIITAKVIGTDLSMFSPPLLQALVSEAAEHALVILSLMTAVFEMVESLATPSLSLKGESSLMYCPEKESQAKKIVDFISKRGALLDILTDITGPIDVVYGERTGLPELRPSNLVVAKFGADGNEMGRVGIIGPTRMAYEDVIPDIEYFALRLGKILAQTLRDMEE